MVQNAMYRASRKIKSIEQEDNNPEEKIEREIMRAYWDRKFKEECKK